LWARRRTSPHAWGLAEPNSNVSSLKASAGYLGNLFEVEDLGATDLKGIAGPVLAWTAPRPSGVEMALNVSGLTESVGREEELLYREAFDCLAGRQENGGYRLRACLPCRQMRPKRGLRPT
jgi:hypothetical protein